MPRAAEARVWWADVEDVRERIEDRRARESLARRGAGEDAVRAGGAGQGAVAVRAPARRGVREVRPGRHLTLMRTDVLAGGAPVATGPRRRPRPRMVQRVGPRPDRVAAWAVVLGFALVLAAILSAHG